MGREKRIVVFDLDDVLVLFVPAIAKWHNEHYDTNITWEQFHSYNFCEVWNIPKEEAIRRVLEFSRTKSFANLEVVPGAQDAVNCLSKRYGLHIATARNSEFHDISHELVSKYFPRRFSRIHFVEHLTDRHRCKSEVCNELNAVAIVDDSYANAFPCVHPSRQVFMIDKPWNKNAEVVHGMTRVFSWDPILKALL